MLRSRNLSIALLCVLLGGIVAGCDGEPMMDDAGTPDAGSDSGPPPVDAGPPLACTDATVVDALLDDTVSVMLDTTMTETRPRDLGLSCGNTEAELRWAPQEVLEVHVPGTGPVAVELDTVFFETSSSFNTVLQVRRTCEQAPVGFFPPTCFDDAGSSEVRSRGSVSAMGGDVLYVLVTGYSEPPPEEGTVDAGPVRLDIRVRANGAPTIATGAVRLAGDDVLVDATGTDPDGDARGVALDFYDAAGDLIDIYGDGEATLDGDAFIVFFSPATTAVDFVGKADVTFLQSALGRYLNANGIRRASLRVFDSAWALSEPLMVDITDATQVGLGETCDRELVCRREMLCGAAGTCAPTSATSRACTRAAVVGLPAVTDTAVSSTVTGASGAGVGNVWPTCASLQGAVGAEMIYSVIVPDGTFDLLATTNLGGTGRTDTILYVRGECADSGTELACNDDRAAGDAQSDVEVRDVGPGTYYLFVEAFGGRGSGSAAHALQITLRPVLATGASCDTAQVMNRCAAGACAGGTCP